METKKELLCIKKNIEKLEQVSKQPKSYAEAAGNKHIKEVPKTKPAMISTSSSLPRVPSPTAPPCESMKSRPPTPRTSSPRRSPFQCLPKVLYVGDSVGHTADLRKIERSHKCRIRSARAYSSTVDKKAKWPLRNFKDVVEENLMNPGNENYDILVMSAPTVDITNLDTIKTSQDENEQIVKESCAHMFKVAQDALTQHTELTKVIVMEHPPRFDDENRAKLAKLANFTLNQLWSLSTLKSKISIGHHSLESTGLGLTHLARYKDLSNGNYDGVHLYGRTGVRDYTDSVRSILTVSLSVDTPAQSVPWSVSGSRDDDHTSCSQAQYQWRQLQKIHKNRQTHSSANTRYVNNSSYRSIPTQNRFNVFSQGN